MVSIDQKDAKPACLSARRVSRAVSTATSRAGISCLLISVTVQFRFIEAYCSGLALAAALFFGDELFHSSGDFVVLEHFPSVDLRQAFFHLAHKPLVVTNQSLHRFMHQGGTIAPLPGGNTVQLGLQFGRKFYFHAVSVSGGSRSVKVLASR